MQIILLHTYCFLLQKSSMHMDNYTFIEKIGHGTHGTVYLLKKKNHIVVCKSIPEKHFKYANREIDLLSSITHKKIIKILDHYINDGCYCIILEYANSGTVFDIIQANKRNYSNLDDDKMVWDIASQLIDAISYLHDNYIIHRDIKPSNVLVNRLSFNSHEITQYKLCDFSLSTKFGVKTSNIVGTPYYMAPEIISRLDYDEKVDVWSYGVLLYEIVTCKKPFNGKTRKDLQKNILKNDILYVPYVDSLGAISKIILGCLVKDSTDRLSSHDIRKIDKINYNLAVSEIQLRDWKINQLEHKIEKLENATIMIETESKKYIN